MSLQQTVAKLEKEGKEKDLLICKLEDEGRDKDARIELLTNQLEKERERARENGEYARKMAERGGFEIRGKETIAHGKDMEMEEQENVEIMISEDEKEEIEKKGSDERGDTIEVTNNDATPSVENKNQRTNNEDPVFDRASAPKGLSMAQAIQEVNERNRRRNNVIIVGETSNCKRDIVVINRILTEVTGEEFNAKLVGLYSSGEIVIDIWSWEKRRRLLGRSSWFKGKGLDLAEHSTEREREVQIWMN